MYYVCILFLFLTEEAYSHSTTPDKEVWPSPFKCQPAPIWTLNIVQIVLQGVSNWNAQSKLALTDEKIEIFNFISYVAYSGGYDIWFLSTSFQKSNIGWPQQPPTKRMSDTSKNWIFDDPFYKKGLVLIIWVLRMIKPSGSVILLMNWGCRGHWGHWGCRGFKAWNITTEDFRVIQGIEFSFILMFWKKNIFGWIMNHHVEF